MFKTLAMTVVAVSSSVAFAADAQAGCRGCCCATCCTAPQACAVAPADPHAGMQMGQAPQARTYQSFSYEPGAVAQPVYSPRANSISSPSSMSMRLNAAAYGKLR
jgi:hypothetical protein